MVTVKLTPAILQLRKNICPWHPMMYPSLSLQSVKQTKTEKSLCRSNFNNEIE